MEGSTFGFGEGEDTPESVAAHVVGVCPGWTGVAVSDVEVKDYSAFGGNRVYKVSAKSAEPPSVALRVDVTEGGDDTLQDDRTQAIGQELSEVGMAPRKIVHGDNWNIEEWSGVSVSRDFSHFDDALAPPSTLAKLMADFHKMPTDWYDEYRARMRERYPFLSAIPPEAPFWNGAAYGWENGMLFTGGKMTPEKEEHNASIFNEMCGGDPGKSGAGSVMDALLKCDALYPKSAAGKRVVTIHGDFKPNNIISTSPGTCMCIDYDFTHVSPVQQELSFAYMKWLGPKHQDYAFRHAFLKQYLEHSALPADDAAIKELMLDAEIGQIGNFDGLLFSGLSREIPLLRKGGKRKSDDGGGGGASASGRELLEHLARFVEDVRASQELTALTIYNGLVPTMYTAQQTAPALRAWLAEMRAAGSLAGFGIYADEATWEENVRVKAVRTPWIPPNTAA